MVEIDNRLTAEQMAAESDFAEKLSSFQRECDERAKNTGRVKTARRMWCSVGIRRTLSRDTYSTCYLRADRYPLRSGFKEASEDSCAYSVCGFKIFAA